MESDLLNGYACYEMAHGGLLMNTIKLRVDPRIEMPSPFKRVEPNTAFMSAPRVLWKGPIDDKQPLWETQHERSLTKELDAVRKELEEWKNSAQRRSKDLHGAYDEIAGLRKRLKVALDKQDRAKEAARQYGLIKQASKPPQKHHVLAAGTLICFIAALATPWPFSWLYELEEWMRTPSMLTGFVAFVGSLVGTIALAVETAENWKWD